MDGHAVATLVVFIISIFFVIHPVSIPTPRPFPRIPINLTTAPVLAVALLWAAQCIDPAVIRDAIVGTEGIKPYNIVILFFSLAYMAITPDIAGIVRATVFWVRNKGGYNGWKLYLYFYIMLTLISILIGNDPMILCGTAFLVHFTKFVDLNPLAWIMAGFAAANTASMVLFVGNPSNIVICEGFNINSAAFTAYTILPFLACSLFGFVALACQFRKQVPREFDVVGYRYTWAALPDPVGAWVGSFMLGANLIFCLVASFFRVDVWMISLPFAAAKFAFDIGRDYYRYSRNIRTVTKDLDAVSVSTSRRLHSLSLPTDIEQSECSVVQSQSDSPKLAVSEVDVQVPDIIRCHRSSTDILHQRLFKRFPTFIAALPRLPFSLVPFAFSQFILIEALSHQGWVNIFADWFVRASHKQVHPTIWLIGVLGVVLSNLAGTNVGATILLTRVVRAADLPRDASLAAAIALAVASNIGAVNFTFSASLTGLLWKGILARKGIYMRQRDFAFWNTLPMVVMTSVGLGIVSAEMAILFRLGC